VKLDRLPVHLGRELPQCAVDRRADDEEEIAVVEVVFVDNGRGVLDA
jgi:hypothetical protein